MATFCPVKGVMMLVRMYGNPFDTTCQTLAIGYNARAQTEVSAFGQAMQQRYPSAFATFRQDAQRGRVGVGTVWRWAQDHPQLALLIVRESAVGITRTRYVQMVAHQLAHDYALLGIESLAIIGLGGHDTGESFEDVLSHSLHGARLRVEWWQATDYP